MNNIQELIDTLQQKQWSIISAENPGAIKASDEDNLIKTELLSEALRLSKHELIPLEGFYGGNKEKSFLVPDLSTEEAFELSKKFDQESVLVPKGLLYRDKSYYAADLNNINFDETQIENYSKIKINNTVVKFSIPIDFDTTLSMSF